MPKGVRKWRLHHFMFDFRGHQGPLRDPLAEVHIRKEIGDAFIAEYFKTIHPQLPVLVQSEIEETWAKFWDTPAIDPKPLKGKELVLIVLALGARVSCVKGKYEASQLENWAAYFAERTELSSTFMLSPNLKATHFMLLKAMYSLQLMKQNDAYLYLGYAARSALSLGIHKSEVVQGNSISRHRLRTTFWVIYGLERACSLFSGRPSSILDDQIDAAYPEDVVHSAPDSILTGPCADLTFVRVCAEMGRIANTMASGLYFPRSVRRVSDLAAIANVAQECTAALESLAHSLPKFLHFYDTQLPVGENWQEIQRAQIGMRYYLMRILIHRPALTYATFFPSRAEAQRTAGNLFDIQTSIAVSVTCAKSIIHIASELCSRRNPDMSQDGGVSFYLLIACITLLFDVLDPATTPEYAKATFEAVESGIQVLDTMQHIGPNNSKELSLDIMKFAKDAVLSGGEDIDLERDLTGSFPWLRK
ncbi:hypothetical protein SLS56_011090 [Neofusicoccum ribis]|uniref:Xylanolytic transcriptional activator regulatory domain-containing protein n=1 Tax=Neofusicoccum ribis TaxID=45134 RepID=A0ABR3SD89_9PEZI